MDPVLVCFVACVQWIPELQCMQQLPCRQYSMLALAIALKFYRCYNVEAYQKSHNELIKFRIAMFVTYLTTMFSAILRGSGVVWTGDVY